MNKAPKALQFALLALVLAGVVVWAWRSFGPRTAVEVAGGGTSGGGAAAVAEPEPTGCVLVTYFTSDQRCPTCLKIEKLTREAVESGFGGDLASGRLRFRTVNFDRPEYQHYAKDYELAFKTVVISDRREGKETKWAKFDKVWDLVDEPQAFTAYLQGAVREYLGKDSDA